MKQKMPLAINCKKMLMGRKGSRGWGVGVWGGGGGGGGQKHGVMLSNSVCLNTSCCHLKDE
jgi:hypothetical protein